MENNSKYDYIIEESIFTDRQKEFLNKNHEELFKTKHEREMAERDITDWEERNRVVHQLMDKEDYARNNLEPFISKSKEYTKKKNDIMKSNNLNLEDFPNEKAMQEISSMRDEMLKESSKYSDDLRTNLEVKKSLEDMFIDDKPKNDLDSMFEVIKNENENSFTKQFK